MRGVVTILAALVVLFVLGLDGASVYAAGRTADEVAQGAAQKAALAYVGSQGDEQLAGKAATTYVAENQAELLGIELHRSDYRWYQAKVEVDPQTRVLKLVPYLDHLLRRVSTAVVQF